MIYKKQEWNNGTRLDASRLNHIEDGIYNCSAELQKIQQAISEKQEPDATPMEDLEKRVLEEIELLKKDIQSLKKENSTLKARITKLQKGTTKE